jgi:putative acetyltransferase
MFTIKPDDLTSPATRALLSLHLAGMQADSPAGHVFALDLSGLLAPDVWVWSAWEGDSIASIGALKVHADGFGEVKSMRTHPDHLHRGAGAAILDRIIEHARQRGLMRLMLETGSGPGFEAAHALYRKRGFVEGRPFADYVQSPFNRFFRLDLTTAHTAACER